MKNPEGVSPLESIVFISLPEELDRNIGGFLIDPSILIPVELLPGQEEWEAQELSWEMIIAAMLKILVYQPEHEHASYYRDFILAARPTIVEDLSESGIAKAKGRDFEIAEEIFQALISLNDQDVHSMLNLALVHEEHAEVYEQAQRTQYAEEYKELAFETYRNALAVSPDNEHVHFNAAHFYLKQHNSEKAREHFERFMALSDDRKRREGVEKLLEQISDQDRLNALFNEAYDFIKLGNEEEGIDKISAFIEKNPEVWNAWFLLGWAHRRLSQYRKGKEAFERALEIGPAHSDTLNELAICLLELQEYEQCRKTLARALKIEPENVKIISNLGILELKEKNLDEAGACFRSVLELSPDDPIAQNYLEYIDAERGTV
jgi:tetratricopeptide (TPR) repeat protein